MISVLCICFMSLAPTLPIDVERDFLLYTKNAILESRSKNDWPIWLDLSGYWHIFNHHVINDQFLKAYNGKELTIYDKDGNIIGTKTIDCSSNEGTFRFLLDIISDEFRLFTYPRVADNTKYDLYIYAVESGCPNLILIVNREDHRIVTAYPEYE